MVPYFLSMVPFYGTIISSIYSSLIVSIGPFFMKMVPILQVQNKFDTTIFA